MGILIVRLSRSQELNDNVSGLEKPDVYWINDCVRQAEDDKWMPGPCMVARVLAGDECEVLAYYPDDDIDGGYDLLHRDWRDWWRHQLELRDKEQDDGGSDRSVVCP